jgi:nucleoid-associated protein YgaU
MKRDARIGLAVMLVLGLSVTLLVARALHKHSLETAGDPDGTAVPAAANEEGAAATELAQGAPDDAAKAEARAQDQALASFRTDHGAVAADNAPSGRRDAAKAETGEAPLDQPRQGAPAPAARQAAPLPPTGQPPIPTGTAQDQGGAAAASPNILGLYTVAPGDNPWKISARIFGDGRHAQKLLDANPGLNPNRLQIGQKLRIPALPGLTPRVPLGNATVPGPVPQAAISTPTTAPVPWVAAPAPRAVTASVATSAAPATVQTSRPPIVTAAISAPAVNHPPVITEVAAAEPVFVLDSTPVAAGAASGAETVAEVKTHTIQPGDTLERLARRYLGAGGPRTVKRLMDANPGVVPTRLQIGTALKIPAAQ